MRNGAIAAALLLAASAAPAVAGEGCHDCYRLVRHPAEYATVEQPYVLRPAQTTGRYVPPEYGTVSERILVSPEHRLARETPAVYETRLERVEVRPPGREWQVRRGRHGEAIGCWVDVPARFATVRRRVVVQPASVTYQSVPAVYATRERTVMLRGGYIQRGVAPAVIASQPREILIRPAGAEWRPIARH